MQWTFLSFFSTVAQAIIDTQHEVICPVSEKLRKVPTVCLQQLKRFTYTDRYHKLLIELPF